jgi:hypothetical protein
VHAALARAGVDVAASRRIVPTLEDVFIDRLSHAEPAAGADLKEHV